MTDLPCPSPSKAGDDAYLDWGTKHSSSAGGGVEEALQVMEPTGVRGVLEEVALSEEPHPSAAVVVYLFRQKEPSFSPKLVTRAGVDVSKPKKSRVLL
jgi:hypothetical protein